MIHDPRDGQQEWPWTLTMIEDVNSQKLTWQITGIPEIGPNVGEMFDAYFIFEGKQIAKNTCDSSTDGLPVADIVRVRWDIYNGPVATVTVADMHNMNVFGIDGVQNDVMNHDWSVTAATVAGQ